MESTARGTQLDTLRLSCVRLGVHINLGNLLLTTGMVLWGGLSVLSFVGFFVMGTVDNLLALVKVFMDSHNI